MAVGVFSVFPPALAKSLDVRPDRLRPGFAISSHTLHFGGEEDGEDYSVNNSSTLRCASHMVVWESYLQGQTPSSVAMELTQYRSRSSTKSQRPNSSTPCR